MTDETKTMTVGGLTFKKSGPYPWNLTAPTELRELEIDYLGSDGLWIARCFNRHGYYKRAQGVTVEAAVSKLLTNVTSDLRHNLTLLECALARLEGASEQP